MSDKDTSGPPESGDEGDDGSEDTPFEFGPEQAEDGPGTGPDETDDDTVATPENAGGADTEGSSLDIDAHDSGDTAQGMDGRDRSSTVAGSSSTDSSLVTDRVVTDPEEIDPEELTVPVRSLHPRVRILWILRALISATIVGGIVAVIDRFLLGVGAILPIGVGGGLALLGIVHALVHYRIWQYEVREDALYLERGVVTRVRTVVPFVRIQHVDTSRSPVERLVGLSTSVVYTAGSRGADVSIPGLEADRAEELQARLKQLAIAAEGDDAV